MRLFFLVNAMVSFYKAEKKTAAPKALEVSCHSLDIQGRGVCKTTDKIYFVDNLLPGEQARVIPALSNAVAGSAASKDKTAVATVTKYLTTSAVRLTPTCPLQERCGGCPLAHIPPQMAFTAKIQGVAKILTKSVLQGMVSAKESKVSQAVGMSKLGKQSTIKQALAQKQAAEKNAAQQQALKAMASEAAAVVAKPHFALQAADSGYRRACRLAVRSDHHKMVLGFREGASQDLVPVTSCEVLTPRLNALLTPLKTLLNQMEGKRSLGHIELLDSDGAVGVLLRLTQKLSAADEATLVAFGQEQHCVLSVLEPFKQLDDTEVVRERLIYDEGSTAADAAIAPASAETSAHADLNLSSALYVMSQQCRIYCSPSSFVQVNAAINARMVDAVVKEVQPHAGQKVLDLFSGLGNFALPLAKAGSSVVGIDIVSDMVRRANYNALVNGISAEQAKFFVADLEAPFESQLWAKDHYDVVVMDPGRMGAKRAVQYMAKLLPEKIIMISCNPLAAARDCSQLLAAHYKISSWSAFDMFPRTRHVEIMLVFTR